MGFFSRAAIILFAVNFDISALVSMLALPKWGITTENKNIINNIESRCFGNETIWRLQNAFAEFFQTDRISAGRFTQNDTESESNFLPK